MDQPTSSSSSGQPSALADALLQLFQRNEFQLNPEQLDQLRQRINSVLNYQATVGVMGKTGAGKSSLCNALFGREVAEVSDVEACTRTPQAIPLDAQGERGLTLIDLPGVGESAERDREYRALYHQRLPELDLVLWVIKADDRALSIDAQFYDSVVKPHIPDQRLPVIFVVSQIDKIEPCREWDWKKNHPGPLQTRNIASKCGVIRQSFAIPDTHLCAVSAEEGYGLAELVEKIVQALPNEKKWSFTRETRAEHVSDRSQRCASEGLWETVKSAAATILRDTWQCVVSGVSALASALFRW